MKELNKDEVYLKGMEDMLKWVQELPIGGSAGRMLRLHLSPIIDWMKRAKKLKLK